MQSLDPQTHTLCQWETISDIHQTLGIKVNTILRVVLRAKTAGQEWIKLEPYPTSQDQRRWLIDINSPEYRYHERRWCKLIADAVDESTQQNSEGALPSGTPSEIQAAWTQLCSLLADLGLVVYVNTIAPNQTWQWQWNGSTGTGYPDAASAMIAALHYQLASLADPDPFLFSLNSQPVTLPNPAKTGIPLWKILFHWKP